MIQKFVISVDRTENKLKIREYAIVDRYPKKELTSKLIASSFSFLYEETYRSESIIPSISKGITDLIATLRTPKFFPIDLYAGKIAESVTALYNLPEDQTIEIIFNDYDFFSSAASGMR